MEWHRITTAAGADRRSWDPSRGQPLEGEPSVWELRVLVDVLRKFTESPERCCFCSWTGFGGTRETGAVVTLPGRDYFLSLGEVEDALSFENPPNLWWPEDRTWCVASEIDLLATYVGGDDEAIAMLAGEDLELLPVAVEDRVDVDADSVNQD